MGTIVYQNNRIDNLKSENYRLDNNVKVYESELFDSRDSSRVLLQTEESYKKSKDSLVMVIRDQSKQLGIKDKQISNAGAMIIGLRDTLKMKVQPSKPTVINPRPDICDFYADSIFNNQTRIQVERIGLNLNVIPTITDSIFIYYYDDRVWKKDMNIFKRIVTFSWGKETIVKHKYTHTNPLIVFDRVRFIKIVNK